MLRLFLKFSIGSWLSAAISLFTTPIITALIIPDEFGKASMYTLAFNLIMQVTLLGTDQGFARNFYKKEGDKHQSTVLFNSIAIPLLLSLVVALLVFVFGKPLGNLLVNTSSLQFTLLLSGSVILGVLERFSMLMLRMKKRAMAFSALRVLFSVINFGVVFFYANFFDKSFYAIIYGNFIALIITITVAIGMERSVWKVNKTNPSLMKEILVYSLPFLPTFVVSWLFEGIDKMALRHYSNFNEIGLFSAAYKIVAILSILQAAFSTFWVPIALEMYEKSSDETKKLFSKVLGYMCAILFICGMGIILFKDLIIRLFEESYHTASSIMPFLLLVPIMYTLSEVTVGGINLRNKTYWHLAIAIVAALVNLFLNILLVPHFGAKGAAAATGVSYVVLFYSRTYISNYLFPIAINFFKIHSSIFLFLVVGLFNTFYPGEVYIHVITMIGIGGVSLIYINELSFFSRTVLRKLKFTSLAKKTTP